MYEIALRINTIIVLIGSCGLGPAARESIGEGTGLNG
jgi:hypothetical protein